MGEKEKNMKQNKTKIRGLIPLSLLCSFPYSLSLDQNFMTSLEDPSAHTLYEVLKFRVVFEFCPGESAGNVGKINSPNWKSFYQLIVTFHKFFFLLQYTSSIPYLLIVTAQLIPIRGLTH